MMQKTILIHIAGGVGDVIMATPLVASFAASGYRVSLYIESLFKQVAPLFADWDCLVKVSDEPGDFEQDSFDVYFAGWLARKPIRFKNLEECRIVQCPYSAFMHSLFSVHEAYLSCARLVEPDLKEVRALYCGKSARVFPDISKNTVVVAPGCQKEYPAKKWDKFEALTAELDNVAVVGMEQDFYTHNARLWPRWILKYFRSLLGYDGKAERLLRFFSRPYLRLWEVPVGAKNYIGLSLADTAALISQAGAVIGNDSGLVHMAAALGIKTVMIFGPTSDRDLVIPPGNTVILKTREDCPCQPCANISDLAYLRPNVIDCPHGMRCMRSIGVNEVLGALKAC